MQCRGIWMVGHHFSTQPSFVVTLSQLFFFYWELRKAVIEYILDADISMQSRRLFTSSLFQVMSFVDMYFILQVQLLNHSYVPFHVYGFV
jgi:hypothetical protein